MQVIAEAPQGDRRRRKKKKVMGGQNTENKAECYSLLADGRDGVRGEKLVHPHARGNAGLVRIVD
jgi:hypothetical protein